jgi:excinuclease ABC subunit B
MYADKMTDSMHRAISETNRRRAIQDKFNKENGITPKTIIKEVRDVIDMSSKDDLAKAKEKKLSPKQKEALKERLTKEMREAAARLDFERAAFLRDSIAKIK